MYFRFILKTANEKSGSFEGSVKVQKRVVFQKKSSFWSTSLAFYGHSSEKLLSGNVIAQRRDIEETLNVFPQDSPSGLVWVCVKDLIEGNTAAGPKGGGLHPPTMCSGHIIKSSGSCQKIFPSFSIIFSGL